MKIRKAEHTDLKSLMQLFESARRIMHDSGNFNQWNNGYPSEEIILKDISNGHCHVIVEDGIILGTMALIPGPDPTYEYIEGEWSNDEPYYVIHRIATVSPGRDVAKTFLDWTQIHISNQGYKVIRIDTHRDNIIMKHILTKYGFKMCGVIYLQNGAPRDAYIYSLK